MSNLKNDIPKAYNYSSKHVLRSRTSLPNIGAANAEHFLYLKM